MGEHAGRDIGRPPVVGHRAVRPPAAGILPGELRRDGIGVVGVQEFEALGDPPVQQPPSRRADLCVCRFAQQVVGEVVAVMELVHDPAAPQLVDCPHHDVGLKIARLGQQVEGEVRAHRRGEARHLPGRRGRLLETVAQHGRKITDREGSAAGIDAAAHGLDDVQRKPPRRRLEQLGVGLTERPPGDSLGQTCRIGGIERAEGKLGEQPGGPHPVGPVRERRVFAGFVVARCRGDEKPGAGGQSQAEREEFQRLLVAPLHVVED